MKNLQYETRLFRSRAVLSASPGKSTRAGEGDGGADFGADFLPSTIGLDAALDVTVRKGEELASESISRPSTIILVTVPAEGMFERTFFERIMWFLTPSLDDLDNQGAMKLAKTADGTGERTIGGDRSQVLPS